MSRYKSIKFVLISPEELRVPDYVKKEFIEDKNIEFKEVSSIDDVISELDILYMTRIQRERFFDYNEYEKLKDFYILNSEKMNKAKRDMIILHPLPRVNEIDVSVDEDPRACYFKQARYGRYVRMALILRLLESSKDGIREDRFKNTFLTDKVCKNPHCITGTYPSLEKRAKILQGEERCAYCDGLLTK
jgi:aspartate carbamoyltransferase catalytic subunit